MADILRTTPENQTFATSLLEGSRTKKQKKADKRDRFIDENSLNDQDIQGIIDQLTKRVGTQVSQQQNLTSDQLQDAPAATKLAASRSAAISGNEAIADQVPKLELAGKQSEINASLAFWKNKQQQKMFKEQQKLQEEANLMSLFTSIGTTLGSELLFPGSGLFTGTEEAVFEGFGS